MPARRNSAITCPRRAVVDRPDRLIRSRSGSGDRVAARVRLARRWGVPGMPRPGCAGHRQPYAHWLRGWRRVQIAGDRASLDAADATARRRGLEQRLQPLVAAESDHLRARAAGYSVVPQQDTQVWAVFRRIDNRNDRSPPELRSGVAPGAPKCSSAADLVRRYPPCIPLLVESPYSREERSRGSRIRTGMNKHPLRQYALVQPATRAIPSGASWSRTVLGNASQSRGTAAVGARGLWAPPPGKRRHCGWIDYIGGCSSAEGP